MVFNLGIILKLCGFYLIFNTVEIQNAVIHSNSGSLKLVYVVFRHGNRTANGPEELYLNDPYREEKYPLVGLGQLTNAGKEREYKIGVALRERYDTFLGPFYNLDEIEPVSTDYNRTKASLLLVLAGLYPPKGEQIWNSKILWQPIPYNYLQRSEDKVLLGVLCPYYLQTYAKYTNSPKVQNEFKKHKPVFDYISKYSGNNVTSFENVYNMYFGLKTEEDWGFTLPKWTDKVWPEKMTELAIREYYIALGTITLKQMAVGYFLEKLINDMKSYIDGTNRKRKIYLNSAHENNVAELLLTLGIFNPPHVPDYGAYLIFELHEINGVYGIKIYYQNYWTQDPQLLKLQNCGTFCEFDKFVGMVEKYIPADPNLCYKI